MSALAANPNTEHRLKIRPHSDNIRRQLDAIPVLHARAIEFTSDWRPCHTWYRCEGHQTGRVYAVRQHKGRVYILRLE